MQESGLYGEAARASLSSGTEKLARIGHGNHASRDFGALPSFLWCLGLILYEVFQEWIVSFW